MLGLAISAGLPLISCHTTDVMNAPSVLKHITNMTPKKFDLSQKEITKETLYYFITPEGKTLKNANYTTWYNKFVEADSVLVIFNPSENAPEYHDVGVLPTPRKFIREYLTQAFDKEKAEELMPALGGITLKEVGEVVRLSMARDGELTAEGINKTRRQIMQPSKGVTLVDTNLPAYLPEGRLKLFSQKEKQWFLNGSDMRLRPRGLLFDGDPGTGKTQAAKYLAKSWGVPLFRLDASVQSKYVGESENNLKKALNQVDHESPCIVLIDEVEKLFSGSGGDTSGTTTKMLGSLLWWLQEHTSRVFTIMTCNSRKAIPPELYRPGRIDDVWVFSGLLEEEALDFIEMVAESFGDIEYADDFNVGDAIGNVYKTKLTKSGETTRVSHSDLTQLVYTWIKSGNITLIKED